MIVCYSQFPKEGVLYAMGGGTRGSTRVGQKAKGVGEIWAKGLIVVLVERKSLGRQAGLGWASLNNSSGLWGLGTAYLSGTWP